MPVSTTTKQKRLIKRFREAGATDKDHAVTLSSLGERHSWIFWDMVKQKVFLSAQNDYYFLDDQTATKFLHRMLIRGLIVNGILLLLVLALIFLFLRLHPK